MTATAYAPQTHSISSLWEELITDRTPALCATTLGSDYRQATSWFGRCPYQEPKDARKAAGWLLAQPHPKSGRKMLMYLRLLMRWACSEEIRLLDHNPLKTYSLPKPPQSDDEIVVIPRVEIPLVIASLLPTSTERPDWTKVAELMVQTGLRTGEVFALRWDDIKDGQLLVHQNYTLTHGLKASTKTNKRRRVPLNAVAEGVLETLPRDGDFIFPAAKWNRKTFQTHFYSRMEQLHNSGLISHRYRPYDLRHTALSLWLEAGVVVTQVAKWAGNSPQIVFKHYVNTTQDFEMPVI